MRVGPERHGRGNLKQTCYASPPCVGHRGQLPIDRIGNVTARRVRGGDTQGIDNAGRWAERIC